MVTCVDSQEGTQYETESADESELTKPNSTEEIKPEEPAAEPTEDPVDPAEKPDEIKKDKQAKEKNSDKPEEGNTVGDATLVEQSESLVLQNQMGKVRMLNHQ